MKNSLQMNLVSMETLTATYEETFQIVYLSVYTLKL